MIHLVLPPDVASAALRLPFYLAMEEYAARKLDGNYFFMWQVNPTVIYGRNQVPESEFDMDYCLTHNIQFYRRKSGGGCVYADRNNIMFSHISDCREVSATFAGYTGAVARMLRSLGISEAATTGRNDIVIGDRKVSGYAFYHVKNAATGRSRAIVHGTMLYDADVETMCAALTPSAAKLATKGVSSVRQRITTVRQHSAVSLDEFKTFALNELCSGKRMLTEQEIRDIRDMEQMYYSPHWLQSRQLEADSGTGSVHIPGVGEIAVSLRCEDGKIAQIGLWGDFFSDHHATTEMLSNLRGVRLDAETLTEALTRAEADRIIPGLPPSALASLIISAGGTNTEQRTNT